MHALLELFETVCDLFLSRNDKNLSNKKTMCLIGIIIIAHFAGLKIQFPIDVVGKLNVFSKYEMFSSPQTRGICTY